ncbi:hypothetical protein [Aphanothece hegewaldii]|nr:hypothetical protein [Aphanothece hegewaldii]
MQPVPDNKIRIDAYYCGMTFEGIALIEDLKTPVPKISIPKPLGIGAIVHIMIMIIGELGEQYKEPSAINYNLYFCDIHLKHLSEYLEEYTRVCIEEEITHI